MSRNLPPFFAKYRHVILLCGGNLNRGHLAKAKEAIDRDPDFRDVVAFRRRFFLQYRAKQVFLALGALNALYEGVDKAAEMLGVLRVELPYPQPFFGIFTAVCLLAWMILLLAERRTRQGIDLVRHELDEHQTGGIAIDFAWIKEPLDSVSRRQFISVLE